MRSPRLLLALTFVAAACTSSSTSTPSSTAAAAGNSCDDAIVIHGKNENDGIKNENQWIGEHFGRFTKNGQSLMHCNNKAVDQIEFTTADGQKRSIYFDISEWFGKW